ncbi:MAG: NADAR family protein [Oleiphilaceae bacterium]|nr:NADAR family protein [Oleiphilaceae bacterium]
MLFPDLDADSIYLHRTNPDEMLASFSPWSFKLEGREWPTVEHYFQAMKFHDHDLKHFQRIGDTPDPLKARKLGRSRLHRVRKDWKQVRRVVMTRALYTRCKTHPEVAKALLDTGERRLVEATQYDYYWGCGRDRRGENQYGELLMDVRRRLREEAETNA